MASTIKVDKIAQASGTPEFTIPTADGTSGQFIKTDASGVLSFGSAPALTGSTNTWIPTITAANALTGTANFTYDGNILDVKNSGTASSIKLYCESSNAHYQAIKAAPHAGSSDWTLTLPPTVPSVSGQALTATTAGVATWATVGGNNAPYWHVYLSADQSISNTVWTKCQFNTEIYDSASEYDSSTNYRYVFGTAGTYLIYSSMNLANDNAVTDRIRGALYKNGSVITGFKYGGGNYQVTTDGILHNKITTWPIFSILTVAASDYIEVFGYVGSYGTADCKIHADSFFGGFKLL